MQVLIISAPHCKMITMLSPYQTDLHTITFDNGTEFAFHEKLTEAYGVILNL